MLAGLALSGCASEPRSAPAPALPTDLPRISTTDRLPFEAYALPEAELARLRADFNALVARCADRFGVRLVLVSEVADAVDDASRMWSGRFGTLPLAHARRHGYHAAPGQPWRQPFTVFRRQDEQPEVQVLYGITGEEVEQLHSSDGSTVPDGGCRAEVSRRIGGDPYQPVPAEANEVRLTAMRDPRTRRAMDEWSECMSEKGHSFPRVDEPVDQALGRKLDDTERGVAVADVECTRTSRWRDISFAIERGLQQRLIDADPERFSGLRARQDQMVQAARTLRLAQDEPEADDAGGQAQE